LIEPKRLAYAMRASRQDAAVLLLTVLCGLFLGLDMAIIVGVALSIVLYVSRAATLSCIELRVDGDGVVRKRLPEDPPAGDFLLYDLEGELFFGAAPHLERHLARILRRVELEHLSHVVLRLKRVRHPDAACLERLEHFLRMCTRQHITVMLAGLQPDLLAAVSRLRFFAWYPPERVYPQGKDEDSATLAAIRAVYRELGNSPKESDPARPLYYLL
jgi:SulP family sulfate permease